MNPCLYISGVLSPVRGLPAAWNEPRRVEGAQQTGVTIRQALTLRSNFLSLES